jgi:hypothetical protein
LLGKNLGVFSSEESLYSQIQYSAPPRSPGSGCAGKAARVDIESEYFRNPTCCLSLVFSEVSESMRSERSVYKHTHPLGAQPRSINKGLGKVCRKIYRSTRAGLPSIIPQLTLVVASAGGTFVVSRAGEAYVQTNKSDFLDAEAIAEGCNGR